MAGGGGRNKNILQYCTDSSRQEIVYLRALQGLSGRNLIDPSLQDNVVIPDGFFKYNFHVGCQSAFDHQFRIDIGSSKFEQSTDSVLSACGSYGHTSQGS